MFDRDLEIKREIFADFPLKSSLSVAEFQRITAAFHNDRFASVNFL